MMDFKYNTSICLICKDENPYINEWLEYHIDIGINHFYIYDNMSTVPIKESIKKEYLNKCTIRDWKLNVKEHGNIQIKCYSNCLYNYSRESKWIAFIDADEFINIKDNSNINDFMQQYEKYDGLYIDWLTYNANGKIKKEDGLVRERFTKVVPYYNDIRGKCIVKAHRIVAMSPHFPMMSNNYNTIVDSDCKRVYSPMSYGLTPMDKITLDHYITKSYEEWIEKLNRGSCVDDFERKMDEFFYFNADLKDKLRQQ